METPTIARAAWLRPARWGVFCHYLAAPASAKEATPRSADDWNRQVEAFDVDRLAQQLATVGAPYFVLTLGQNSGFYCSPNATYDALVSDGPSRLSRRDLVAELADALRPAGTRLLVYLPSHAPAHHRAAVEGLACTPPWDASAWGLRPGSYLRHPAADARLSAFQGHWEAIVREWSERWGDTVAGWWIDGCYHADRMYRESDAPNFASFAAALRAGNPQAIVAFNPGVRVPVVCATEHEDFTAGEIADSLPLAPPPRCIDGHIDGTAQYHLLTYLGAYWGRGEPRFDADFVAATTRLVNTQGGVVTWDVPISDDGAIPDAFLERLSGLPQLAPATADDEPSGALRSMPSTRHVEPRYIRLVRAAARQTQAQLAATLEVHVRTVVGWETSDDPVRIRAATYDRLAALAAQHGIV